MKFAVTPSLDMHTRSFRYSIKHPCYFLCVTSVLFSSSCILSGRAAQIIMPPVYITDGHEYATMQSYFNRSYYAMLLPPVPKDCPTPMGVAGMHV